MFATYSQKLHPTTTEKVQHSRSTFPRISLFGQRLSVLEGRPILLSMNTGADRRDLSSDCFMAICIFDSLIIAETQLPMHNPRVTAGKVALIQPNQ